jgi:hypothetical protein
MLAYVLALVVGLGSFALYMAAFFFPEVHRKNDLIWSGIGLFYALVLWACAGRITGGVLLGQVASVALIGWLGWQTLTLRRQTSPAEQQTPVPTAADVQETLANLTKPETLSKVPGQLQQQFSKFRATVTQPKRQPASPEEPYVPLTPADFASAQPPTEVAESAIAASAPVAPPEVMPPEVKAPEVTIVPESTVTPTPPAAAAPTEPAPSLPKRVGGAFGAIASIFTKKQESKPIYVRKQFRTAAPDSEDAEADKAEADKAAASQAALVENAAAIVSAPIVADGVTQDDTLTGDAVVEAELAFEATKSPAEESETAASSETTAVPPHPPSPELVEAAIADAEEKHLPAEPPATEAAAPEDAASSSQN